MSERLTAEHRTELRRLREAADLDPLKSTHIISRGYEHLANLTEEIGERSKPRGRCLAMIPKEWADYVAAAVNAVPVLLDHIDALQRELAEARRKAEHFDAICSSVKQGPRLLTWDAATDLYAVQEAEDIADQRQAAIMARDLYEQMRQRAERAEADSRRLDWLDQQPEEFFSLNAWEMTSVELRSFIDAAMDAAK